MIGAPPAALQCSPGSRDKLTCPGTGASLRCFPGNVLQDNDVGCLLPAPEELLGRGLVLIIQVKRRCEKKVGDFVKRLLSKKTLGPLNRSLRITLQIPQDP